MASLQALFAMTPRERGALLASWRASATQSTVFHTNTSKCHSSVTVPVIATRARSTSLVYNLHAQSGTSSADLTASESDVTQMLGYIEANSAGNAVMVIGDAYMRYTRVGQNMWQFLRHGFTDVWIKDIRLGDVPVAGSPNLVCGAIEANSPTCEVTDKVLFRDNGFVGLQAGAYLDRQDAVDAAGVSLSDHHPIEVNWSYATAPGLALSDQWGGPHGTNYNDVSSTSGPISATG